MNDANVLVRFYREHVATPDDTGGVYGYWAIVAGAVVFLAATATYLAAELFVAGPSWGVRRATTTALFLVAPVFVAGVANVLPGGRWTARVSLVGVLPGVVAAAGVVLYYPQQFNVTNGPDMAPELVGLLVLGLAIQLLAIALHPLLADGAGSGQPADAGQPVDASQPVDAGQPAETGRSAERQGGKGRF